MQNSIELLEKKIKSLKSLEFLYKEEYKNFIYRTNEIEQQINDREFIITVVGEFSAGKSTFLNALIGKDVLPHAVRETTASVTYIKNVPENHPKCNKIVINFYDERLSVELDFINDPNILRNYVTTMADSIDVVNEVESVNIYLKFPYTDDPIVFIDTPGLNGMAEGHYERTLQEIQRAHASIYLFHIRGLSKSNVELYQLLKQYQSSLIFVMNFIDELRASEGETVEGKIEELRRDLVKIGVDKDIPIFGISSLRALAGKDKKINRLYSTDVEDIKDEERSKLIDSSRFPLFENHLWAHVLKQEQQNMKNENLNQKIKKLYLDIREELLDLKDAYTVEVNHEERIIIEDRIKKLKEFKIENWNNVENFLISERGDIIEDSRKEIPTSFEPIKQQLQEYINGLSANDLENGQLLEGKIKKKISNELVMVTNNYSKDFVILLEAAYQGAILKIKSYHPKIEIKKGDTNIKLTFVKNDMNNIGVKGIIGKIHKKREDQQRMLENQQEVQFQISMQKQEQQSIERNKKNVKSELQSVMQQEKTEINRLGRMPDVRSYSVEVPYEVTRSIVNPIRWFGNKTKTEYRTEYRPDDSDRRAWLSRREQIQRDYSNKRNSLKVQEKTYSDRIAKLENEQLDNEVRLDQYRRQLQSLKNEIVMLEKEHKEIFEKNKRAFEKLQRTNLRNQVTDYLETEVAEYLEKELKRNIKNAFDDIWKLAKNEYNSSYDLYLNKLNALLKQNEIIIEPPELKMIRTALKDIEREMKVS
ncbi:dynamin family protein [Bacillus sp. FJAT-42315]|uniref:dynamin family protein n=1 Tax=Bacillus sp. FJAT-42315 TaxID=2014077 RepID=UPI0012FF39DA|nr:dynamin family protein [Bacillus sp. FJAT-42315]